MNAFRAAALALAAEHRLDHAFLAATGEEAADARAVVPTILICNMDRRPDPADYVRETIERGDPFIQLRGHFDDPRFPAWIEALQQAGITINYYGTNDPDEYRRLRRAGVQFPLVDDVHLMPAKAELVTP